MLLAAWATVDPNPAHLHKPPVFFQGVKWDQKKRLEQTVVLSWQVSCTTPQDTDAVRDCAWPRGPVQPWLAPGCRASQEQPWGFL